MTDVKLWECAKHNTIGSGDFCCSSCTWEGRVDKLTEERDAALLQVRELQKFLRAAEWEEDGEHGDHWCDWCNSRREEGHKVDCALAKILGTSEKRKDEMIFVWLIELVRPGISSLYIKVTGADRLSGRPTACYTGPYEATRFTDKAKAEEMILMLLDSASLRAIEHGFEA